MQIGRKNFWGWPGGLRFPTADPGAHHLWENSPYFLRPPGRPAEEFLLGWDMWLPTLSFADASDKSGATQAG